MCLQHIRSVNQHRIAHKVNINMVPELSLVTLLEVSDEERFSLTKVTQVQLCMSRSNNKLVYCPFYLVFSRFI